ncbi:hypothetical protein XELAEV_18031386mg [Xenopus laevis]|uniref:Uncharacterized protein n=1 Tax=Xenopus laevis TaxID=8355 RepID=A0A974CP52_XENLA|nr:hypothetical protein XELAEV_18031386mg [Xenopus laevis]
MFFHTSSSDAAQVCVGSSLCKNRCCFGSPFQINTPLFKILRIRASAKTQRRKNWSEGQCVHEMYYLTDKQVTLIIIIISYHLLC